MSHENVDPMLNNPCNGCDHCCRHIALEIDEPETDEEFDQIRWYLVHKDVWVFIDHDNSWNLQVNNKCEKLGEDGLCKYYEDRPQICRDYSADNCERHGEGDSFKLLWKTVEQFESWIGEGKIIPEDEEEDSEEEYEDDEAIGEDYEAPKDNGVPLKGKDIEEETESGSFENLSEDENFLKSG